MEERNSPKAMPMTPVAAPSKDFGGPEYAQDANPEEVAELELLDGYSEMASSVYALQATISNLNTSMQGLNESLRTLEKKAGLIVTPFSSSVYEYSQALRTAAAQAATEASNAMSELQQD